MNIKKIIYPVCGLVLLLASCKKEGFLDQKQTTTFDETSTFADSLRTIQFVNAIYSEINVTWTTGFFNGGGGLQNAGDESDAKDQTTSNAGTLWVNGIVSAINYGGDTRGVGRVWSSCFANIRRVNIVLKNVGKSPLSEPMKTRLRGEVRFLRAWYYFNLLKAYAGVPILKDSVYNGDDVIDLPRNTYAETVDYIAAEADAAAGLLQFHDSRGSGYYDNNADYGRATKGACLGLKSRLFLYAASPLFNGGAVQPDPIFGYPAADKERWKKAVDAAEAVIASGKYTLYTLTTSPGLGFAKVFSRTGGFAEAVGSTPTVYGEYIIPYTRADNKVLETKFDPPTRNGVSDSQPYQELVDAFPMKNGMQPFNANGSVNVASGYDAASPYANRDPRLDYSIMHDGSLRALASASNAKVALNLITGNDAFGTGTLTGYYVFKMLDEFATAAAASPNAQRADPLMRYAEILLNDAEAINEYSGPITRVYDLLKMIRVRAGITPGADNLYGLTAGMSQDQMREAIRNERRVELAFEEHRFWDVRRWKIAMVTDNKTFSGMKVSLVGSTKVYERVNVRTHFFTPAMYLFPISQTEIVKSPALKQNPGY